MTLVQWIRCGWAWLRGCSSFEFVSRLPANANGRLDWTLARHADLWFPGYRKQTCWRGTALSISGCGAVGAEDCGRCTVSHQYIISRFDRILADS